MEADLPILLDDIGFLLSVTGADRPSRVHPSAHAEGSSCGVCALAVCYSANRRQISLHLPDVPVPSALEVVVVVTIGGEERCYAPPTDALKTFLWRRHADWYLPLGAQRPRRLVLSLGYRLGGKMVSHDVRVV